MRFLGEKAVGADANGHGMTCQRLAREGQHGLTLIELIVALAVISLIAGVTVVAIDQLLRSTRQANDQQYAVSQLRQAEHWMTRDILMTKTIGNSDFLNLSWENVEETEAYEVTYMLEGPQGSLRQLRRSETIREIIDGEIGSIIGNGSLVVAVNIGEHSTWSYLSPIVEVTLTAHSGSHEETRMFEVRPRRTNVDVGETS